MSKKYKSVKIQTKDGKKSKYVDLYPITEVGIPRKALDPTIWDIPEGFYALDIKSHYEEIFLKDNSNKQSSRPLLVHLFPIIEGKRIPKEALDPTIWNIPEGYYALDKQGEIVESSKRKSLGISIIGLKNPTDENISMNKVVKLYLIDNYNDIPKIALDPMVWDIPDEYYAIEI